MSIVIAKVSLYGKLPTLQDSYFLLFLGIHFLTFVMFHTHIGDEVMNKINKSKCRIVIQETFKGYGKGLNLIKLVHKGMKLHTNTGYFVLVLVLRGSASAMFKAFIVSLIEKKPVKTEKAKNNFLFIAVPSIMFYISSIILNKYTGLLKSIEISEHLLVKLLPS
jgi:hypothetical protein